MNYLNAIVPLISCVVSVTFTVLVFLRFLRRKGLHLLLWSIGMLFYAVGGLCESYTGAFGWHPFMFRLWYLFGAILVAAWLGQGTVYLLLNRVVAHVLGAILLITSVFAAVRTFGAVLNPAVLSGTGPGVQLDGSVIVSAGVRTLTPFFNTYGTLALVGGAIYSAVVFFRKRVMPNRVVGNVLIAVGALLPAIGGSFSALGVPSLLYFAELLGAVLMFIGFLRATASVPAVGAQTAAADPPRQDSNQAP